MLIACVPAIASIFALFIASVFACLIALIIALVIAFIFAFAFPFPFTFAFGCLGPVLLHAGHHGRIYHDDQHQVLRQCIQKVKFHIVNPNSYGM